MATIPPSSGESDIASKLKNEILTTHEDTVKQTADKVLSQPIPWDGYQRANLILEKELDLIKKYDKKSDEVKKSLIQKDGETYAELFLLLLVKINKEETLQYLLTLIDQLLTDNPQAVSIFLKLSAKNSTFPFEPLLRLLNRANLDWYTNAKVSSVTATLMSEATNISEEQVKFLVHWLREQLKKSEEKDVCNAVSALQKLARKDVFRLTFAEYEGLQLLVNVLDTKSKNFQILYDTLYSLWLLSYHKQVADQLAKNTNAINSIASVLKRGIAKEKVTRMCLAILVNLLSSASTEAMINAGLLKPIDSLSHKNWADEDIVNDLKTVNEALQRNLAELSSFDILKSEISSGSLEWSPVHKSEKFWKENVHRFEEDNYKALKSLKDILTSSSDPLVLAVACFDIGEFARFHPRGKVIVGELGVKLPIMNLMEKSSDAEVRKQALLAVQKLMVTNWEYLTR